MDASKIVLVDGCLEYLEGQECSETYTMCLHLEDLIKVIKCIPRDTPHIVIKINPEKIDKFYINAGASKFSLKTLDIEYEQYNIPMNLRYESINYGINSYKFSGIIQQQCLFDENVDICHTKRKLTFSNPEGEANVEFYTEMDVSTNSDEPIQLQFSLKYLGLITKNPISDEMALFLDPQKPLKITYTIDNTEISLYLAPKISI